VTDPSAERRMAGPGLWPTAGCDRTGTIADVPDQDGDDIGSTIVIDRRTLGPGRDVGAARPLQDLPAKGPSRSRIVTRRQGVGRWGVDASE
jgi:hypothetical protein